MDMAHLLSYQERARQGGDTACFLWGVVCVAFTGICHDILHCVCFMNTPPMELTTTYPYPQCDEGKPYCNNCKKHGVDCDFLTQSSDPTDLAAPLTPSLASSASLLGADAMAGELNMLDLELMHNFTTATYHTLSTDPVVRDFWRITVVQMALRCPYVMRAMLSVSALHIAHFRPDRRDYYCAAAALHHQRASRAAMQLLSTSFSKEVGRNLYLFSLLTNFYGELCPRFW